MPEFEVHTHTPVKDPLFDTLLVPASGKARDELFWRFAFPDGTRKREGVDWNMTQCGQLGTPVFFDLVLWDLVFEEWADPKDIPAILAGLRLRLALGMDEASPPLTEAHGSEFWPALSLTGSDFLQPHQVPYHAKPVAALVNEEKNIDKLCRALCEQLRDLAKAGLWTHFTRGIALRRAFRFESTTAFRVVADCDAGPLRGPARLKVLLRGVKYRYAGPGVAEQQARGPGAEELR